MEIAYKGHPHFSHSLKEVCPTLLAHPQLCEFCLFSFATGAESTHLSVCFATLESFAFALALESLHDDGQLPRLDPRCVRKRNPSCGLYITFPKWLICVESESESDGRIGKWNASVFRSIVFEWTAIAYNADVLASQSSFL